MTWSRTVATHMSWAFTYIRVQLATSPVCSLQGGDGPSKEEEQRAEKEREQKQKVCP